MPTYHLQIYHPSVYVKSSVTRHIVECVCRSYVIISVIESSITERMDATVSWSANAVVVGSA